MTHYSLVLLMGILAVAGVIRVTNASAEKTFPRMNDTTSDSCPDPFVQVGGQCVHFDLAVSGTWEEMRTFCQMQKGDLIVLSDPQFYVDIVHYIRTLGTITYFWIGATDELKEGEWVWVDGTPVSMGTPYWSVYGCDNGQMPNGGDTDNCALLDGPLYYFFNDSRCSADSFHPACQL